jgi:hypothetical protein
VNTATWFRRFNAIKSSSSEQEAAEQATRAALTDGESWESLYRQACKWGKNIQTASWANGAKVALGVYGGGYKLEKALAALVRAWFASQKKGTQPSAKAIAGSFLVGSSLDLAISTLQNLANENPTYCSALWVLRAVKAGRRI